MAAERVKDEDLTAMREAVAVMERSQKDPEAYIEADLDFHLALAEAAANPLILSLIDSIVGLLREQRIKIFNVEGGPQRGQFHHKRILEAMERAILRWPAAPCAPISSRCARIPRFLPAASHPASTCRPVRKSTVTKAPRKVLIIARREL